MSSKTTERLSILLTGGTGSFGRAFVERVLQEKRVSRLVVFSRDEDSQAEMAARFPTTVYPELRYFIGDVRDQERLEMAMSGVDTVVHAAAMKHVPAAEYNPFECIKTNVHGAENVVRAAMRCGIRRVIALSTDKAASPINLYGASKLASDKIFVAANNLSRGETLFSVVRYGNVIGSRGSVVKLFNRLISEGADSLPITDDRMTRFWITLTQGVDFVLSSLRMMQGGEIFVPRIPSMKITELAKAMAPNLPHRIVGIRPGEKLHELMISEDDSRTTIELGDRYIILPEVVHWRGDATPSYTDGKPVANGFRYASDTNKEWLDAASFSRLLNG